MDLLAKRWANPFLMLDEFIRQGQLHNLVFETLKSIAEERVQSNRWDYYIHRVCMTSDMSFEEYVQYCEGKQSEKCEMTCEQIGTTISDSKAILEAFK